MDEDEILSSFPDFNAAIAQLLVKSEELSARASNLEVRDAETIVKVEELRKLTEDIRKRVNALSNSTGVIVLQDLRRRISRLEHDQDRMLRRLERLELK